ncbi:hypothetical protein ACVXHA_10835 [Escherichia coli]
MKQGLQLRLSQQLAMTPQLQQAIRLLQLSTLELQQELQQALERNPLLEQIDTHEEIDTRERKTVKRWTPPTRSNKEMPEELPLMPVGTPFTPLVHHPAPAVTTFTMSCRSIRAKRRRPCRIT